MPLKIVPPRTGKTPYYYIRGTYLGTYVDRSTKATDRVAAAKFLKLWKEEIEAGTFKRPDVPTFLDAAVSYMADSGQERFLEPLIEMFGDRIPASITQQEIDNVAISLYPKATAATRNRQVHTPMSAILKHAGIEKALRRPKGWRGDKRTDWHTRDSAFEIFEAAAKIDKEFEIFLRVICYTGLRLGEALSLEVNRLELDRNFCYCGKTKNGEPRAVHLPPHLVESLRAHPRGLKRPGEKLFRFRKNGRLYHLINAVKKAAGQDALPGKFHIFRHTYGTWMSVFGGLDAEGLVATGAWKNEESARRYKHTITTKEAQQADLLPESSKKTG